MAGDVVTHLAQVTLEVGLEQAVLLARHQVLERVEHRRLDRLHVGVVGEHQRQFLLEHQGAAGHGGDDGPAFTRIAGEHRDVGPLQDPEHAHQRLRLPSRTRADRGDDSDILRALDDGLEFVQGVLEARAQRGTPAGTPAVDEVDHAAARRRLRGEHHLDAVVVQHTEDLRGGAGEVFQLRHVDGEEGQPLQRGDRLDVLADGIAGDDGAGLLRREGRQDADGDILGDGRADGARVEHLRPEVRQLLRLVERDGRHDAGIGDLPRVGREDAGNIGPDLHFVGIDRGAGEGGGVVGAAAPEGGRLTVGGKPDEAGHDDGEPLLDERQDSAGGGGTGFIAQRAGRAEAVVGGNHRVGPDVGGRGAARAEGGGHHHAHRLLAGGDDAVREAIAELSGGSHLVERCVQAGVEVGENRRRAIALGRNGNAGEDAGMLRTDLRRGDSGGGAITLRGQPGGFEQQVRDATGGGDDGDARRRLRLDDGRGIRNLLEGANRGAAELEYDHRLLLARCVARAAGCAGLSGKKEAGATSAAPACRVVLVVRGLARYTRPSITTGRRRIVVSIPVVEIERPVVVVVMVESASLSTNTIIAAGHVCDKAIRRISRQSRAQGSARVRRSSDREGRCRQARHRAQGWRRRRRACAARPGGVARGRR